MTDADAKTRSRLLSDPSVLDGPRLVVVWEGGAATRSLPDDGHLVLGRGLDCDLRILSESVSRRHVIVHGGRPPQIEDLGSSNGTQVAGRRLAAGQRVPLMAGQVVEIGNALVVLQDAVIGPVAPSLPQVGGDAMESMQKLADIVASGDINVILQGETGVGKEVMAQRIHERSPRARGPFVKINCAAFSETLVEAELFGYEKGAFTGADRAKPGLIEAAHGGTLLLDEVGDLPRATQAKLLRAVGNGEVLRVGALSPRQVDVRFLAATHQPFDRAIAEGAFRADLYFRLNGITITIPPLRERRRELVPLIRLFAAEAARRQGRPAPECSPAALAWLEQHPWPGNVRELRSAVERAVLMSGGATLEPAHFVAGQERAAAAPPGAAAVPTPSGALPDPGTGVTLTDAVEKLERERIEAVLAQCAGNQTKAAKMLGISRRMLLHRLDTYGLPRPRKGH